MAARTAKKRLARKPRTRRERRAYVGCVLQQRASACAVSLVVQRPLRRAHAQKGINPAAPCTPPASSIYNRHQHQPQTETQHPRGTPRQDRRKHTERGPRPTRRWQQGYKSTCARGARMTHGRTLAPCSTRPVEGRDTHSTGSPWRCGVAGGRTTPAQPAVFYCLPARRRVLQAQKEEVMNMVQPQPHAQHRRH